MSKQTCNNCYNYYHASNGTLQMFDHCMEAEYQPCPEDTERIFNDNNANQTCKLWHEKMKMSVNGKPYRRF